VRAILVVVRCPSCHLISSRAGRAGVRSRLRDRQPILPVRGQAASSCRGPFPWRSEDSDHYSAVHLGSYAIMPQDPCSGMVCFEQVCSRFPLQAAMQPCRTDHASRWDLHVCDGDGQLCVTESLGNNLDRHFRCPWQCLLKELPEDVRVIFGRIRLFSDATCSRVLPTLRTRQLTPAPPVAHTLVRSGRF
jgi:hypothetical protein